MPSSCVVVDCCDKYSHNDGRSYHKFPLKRKEILRLWIEFAQRAHDWQPNKWSSICSRHFREEDFNIVRERRTLKKTAVPSIRDLGESTENEKQSNFKKKKVSSSESGAQYMPNDEQLEKEKQQEQEEQEEKSEVFNTATQLKITPAKVKTKKHGLGKRMDREQLFAALHSDNLQQHEKEATNQTPKDKPAAEQSQHTERLSTGGASNATPKLCRLCALRCNQTTTFMKNFDIYGKVQKCLPTLNIKLNDNLPKEVCQQCLQQLEQFALFVDGVLEAQRHLLAKHRLDRNTKAMAAECRSLKIKQEPCVNVKQETADCTDSYYPDDLDMGLDECCEQDSQEVQDAHDNENSQDRKLGFCDFTLPNAQEIIDNCDIMEIINLDDPFIDIPDDDTVMADKDAAPLSAHCALQAYLLADEHNYATPPFLLPKEEQQQQQQKQAKNKCDIDKSECLEGRSNSPAVKRTAANSHEQDAVAFPPKDKQLPVTKETAINCDGSTTAALNDIQTTLAENSARSTKPIVTSVSEILQPHHQFTESTYEHSTDTNFVSKATSNSSSTRDVTPRQQKDTVTSKPNIVVLNESIVKSTEAFRIQECAICQLKFFSIDSLRLHVNNLHASAPNEVRQPMVSLPALNLQESNSMSFQTMTSLHGKEQRYENCLNYYQDYTPVSKPQSQLQLSTHSSNVSAAQQPLVSVSTYDGHVNSNILLNSGWSNANATLLHTTYNDATASTPQLSSSMPSTQLQGYHAQQQHNTCQLTISPSSHAPPAIATGPAPPAAAIYEPNINWQQLPAQTQLDNFHFKQEQDAAQLPPCYTSDTLQGISSGGGGGGSSCSTSSRQITLRYKYLQLRYQRLLERCEALEQCADRSDLWPRRQGAAAQPRRLRCLLCPGRKFVSIYALLRHKHLQHRQLGTGQGKPLYFYAKCSGCLKHFASKLALNNHMRYICQNLSLRCLKLQMQSYKCRVCQSSSYSHWRLLRHHELRCRHKNVQRSQKRHLQQQLTQQRQQQRLRPQKCTKCTRMLSCQDEAQAHALLHKLLSSQTASWSLQCCLCSRKFSHADALLRHHTQSTAACLMVATHKQEIWAKCNYCQKMLLLVDELEAHRSCYTRIEKSVCAKSRQQQMPQRPACPVKPQCKATSRSARMPQLQSEPSTARQFSCLICQKRFTAARYLRQHQLTHLEEKTHACNMCHRSFKQRSGLWQHYRGFHMQLKPYICEVCSHAYTLKGDMQRCRHFDLRNRN